MLCKPALDPCRSLSWEVSPPEDGTQGRDDSSRFPVLMFVCFCHALFLPNNFCFSTMAVKTKAHIKRFFLSHNVHFFNGTMAVCTGHTCLDVNVMSKIYKIT